MGSRRGADGRPEGARVILPTPGLSSVRDGVWGEAQKMLRIGRERGAMERWLESEPRVKDRAPDRVGFDASGTGQDRTIAAPTWGMNIDDLAHEYIDAKRDRELERLAELRASYRLITGRFREPPQGRGDALAAWLAEHYPESWWMIEDVDEGKSALDFARTTHGHQRAMGVNPADAPPADHPLDGEILCGNFRAYMYVRAALLINAGLWDLPPDEELKEELLAMELKYSDRRQTIDGKVRPVAFLISKRELKKANKLGRSPDKADALVMSALTPRDQPIFQEEDVDALYR